MRKKIYSFTVPPNKILITKGKQKILQWKSLANTTLLKKTNIINNETDQNKAT